MQLDLFRPTAGMGLSEAERVARLKLRYHAFRRAFIGPPCPDLGDLMIITKRPARLPQRVTQDAKRGPYGKLSREEVQRRITAAGRGLVMVGPYVRSADLTDFTCANGHTFKARPHDAMRGFGCRACCAARPLTTAEVVARLAELGKGIELIGSYVSGHVPARFRCSQGHEFETLAGVPLRGYGCNICRLARRDAKGRLKASPAHHAPPCKG